MQTLHTASSWRTPIAAAAALASIALSIADARAEGNGPGIDAKSLAAKLEARQPEAVIAALQAARDAGTAAAETAPAVEQLLAHGATAPVTKVAIEALGAMELASSSPVIRPYLRHRTAELRRVAATALARTKGPDAIAALREGLHSSDAAVRGYAATGLGALGAVEAIPELFASLDRKVFEAAAAIGQLCAPASCRELAARLGTLPLDVMASGFEPILFRTSPLPDDVLLDLVRKLQALATPEAGKFLADVQSRWPKSASQAVKRAIDAAVASIPGARS